MSVIQRVKRILLQPNDTWPEIAGEHTSAASIYTGYVMVLAAIPALASFIGLGIFGFGGLGPGLVQAVLGYVLTLVAVFVLAWIADALAPTFGGSKSPLNALKLVAYASTAGLVGGIFALVPMLWFLSLLASLYGIYLLYTGVPVLMKTSREKALPYTAVLIVCGIGAMLVLGALTSLVVPSPAALGGVGLTAPGGSKLDAVARQMEEAGKRMEAAQAQGDTAGASQAMGDLVGAMAGAKAGGARAIDPQQLKALLPESLGDLQRDTIEAQSSQAMGVAASVARAEYANGERRISLSVTDMGGMAGLAALAGWGTMDRETADEVEKVYKDGARTVREQYAKDGSRGEVAFIFDNGLLVEAAGDGIAQPALRRAAESIDGTRLASLKRSAQ